MANLNVQIAGATVQIIDNSVSVIRVNTPIANVVGQVSASIYDAYYLVTNPGPAAFGLPAATVWTVYIRNISGTNSVSVVLTPAGGTAWTSPYVMPPNSIFYIGASYSSNPASGGFTAMSLGSSGAGTYAEVMVSA